MATTDPCPSCPLRERLERAKVFYRAQHANVTSLEERIHEQEAVIHELGEILSAQYANVASLEERIHRYKRIGLRRFQQPAAQALCGTEVWYQNGVLGRALQQRDATIQRQARIIAALKALRSPDEAQDRALIPTALQLAYVRGLRDSEPVPQSMAEASERIERLLQERKGA